MKTITIGESESGAIKVDLAKLVDTRALIQANSGGGKSWLMRVLAEKSIESVQTIILDWEGEFATLREKHDLLLIGKDGEVQADPRGAGILARKLAELRVSAVVDLYDLEIPDRRGFVRLFLENLVAIPKTLYHPMLVFIDEAHMLCPERSAGEAESTQAVINLLSLGRKRGMCGILATQRLSKLHKDAEAECNNMFIGRTILDIDQKRAAGVLGFKAADAGILRDLNNEFYTFGPAVNVDGVKKFKPGAVETTHPKAGQRHELVAPKASAVIKELVTHLADLPEQAMEEARTLGEAKRQIAELSRQLKKVKAPAPVEVASKRERQIIQKLRTGIEDAMKVTAKINAAGFEKTGVDPVLIQKAIEAATGQIVKLVEADLLKKNAEFEKLRKDARATLARLAALLGQDTTVDVAVKHQEPFTIKPAAAAAPAGPPPAGRSELLPTELSVLDAAAAFPDGATRQRISIFSGRSFKSSSFKAAFGTLIDKGLLEERGESYIPTSAGHELAVANAGTSLADWIRKLKPSEAAVLKTIAEASPARVTRAQVSEISGQSLKSSSFKGAFGQLRDLKLIEGESDFALCEGVE